MRIIGLDIGSKRIGVAVSDALCVIAQPLTTVLRSTFEDEIKIIKKYIEDYDVDKVVVGVPYSLSGEIGPQGKLTLDYIEKLQSELQIPVIECDERFTTYIAKKTLILANMRRAERKKVIDKVSAVLILQSYLDSSRENR
ncbi:Holliday junction resolvase RuvX [Candidatus Oleimmundimicrobium sp.]|uniref:Holliday junction resolvase RuvX n=1 Tax=Candidatus Oleimmundimicrobium sp. TaxID=3060597 RepID=UPI00271D805C|nr:Holliday junction resolvase RuvX [Candidatus Oleimmundimicrobium sp.]MDO8886742.1 Holliday junction resolvase RuvX [Candidatus Oleimmundimicrobium sp.]